MSKIYKVLFLLLLVCTAGVVFAQQTQDVMGKVTDEDGVPVAGASVRAVGSRVGAATDAAGSFKFRVPQKTKMLSIDAIGYIAQTVSVTGSSLSIVLVKNNEATVAGEEVVVIGYGTSTKEAFTGSAKTVKAGELQSKNVANVSQALAGEVAGVRVINTSGQPGSEATIRIRGFGSVNGNRDPLYVVDGIPYTGSINAINMADVESTTVLKDAVATAIYGSRGANGVVIITTKSGRSAKSYVEADAKIGRNLSLLPRYSTIKSPETYIGLAWEALYNQAVANKSNDPVAAANAGLFSKSGIAPIFNMWDVKSVADLIDPVTRTVRSDVKRKYTPENWEAYAFQPAVRNEFNVKFGGGNSKTNYYSSVGYLKDQGYSINSSFERATFRLNLKHEVNKWLETSANMSYALSNTNVAGQAANSKSIFMFVDNIPSIYPLFLRDKDGNIRHDSIFGGNRFDYGENGRKFSPLTNAIADATYDILRHRRHEMNSSMGMTIKILPELTFENTLGGQYYNNAYLNLSNKFYGSAASQGGSIIQKRTEMFNYNILNLLRYKNTFGEHALEALVAHEASDWKQNILSVSKYRMVQTYGEDLNNAVVSRPSDSYTNSFALESYFGQINYDYNNRYYISTTLRRDGSSRFLNNKWGTFGSIGGAWVISNEHFMKKQNVLQNLKLKASYGLMGEQAGIGYYSGYDLYEINNLNDYPAFAFNKKGNPDLTWETSKMLQVGIEFRLQKVLSASFDYYRKLTKNLIFDKRVGPSIGYAIITVNDGNLLNQGFEFDLSANVLSHKDYYFNLGVNGEIPKNKLLNMPTDLVTKKEKPIDIQGVYGRAVGHSIYDFYTREFLGVDPATGVSEWTAYYDDKNGNGVADAGEYIASLAQFEYENPGKAYYRTKTTSYAKATSFFVGKSAIPKLRGAFTLDGGYKGFVLSAQLLYGLGGYAYDYAYAGLMANDEIGSNNWHTDILNRWQKPGDVTDVPRLSNALDVNVTSTSTRFLTKADYIALNNIRFGYLSLIHI